MIVHETISCSLFKLLKVLLLKLFLMPIMSESYLFLLFSMQIIPIEKVLKMVEQDFT